MECLLLLLIFRELKELVEQLVHAIAAQSVLWTVLQNVKSKQDQSKKY